MMDVPFRHNWRKMAAVVVMQGLVISCATLFNEEVKDTGTSLNADGTCPGEADNCSMPNTMRRVGVGGGVMAQVNEKA